MALGFIAPNSFILQVRKQDTGEVRWLALTSLVIIPINRQKGTKRRFRESSPTVFSIEVAHKVAHIQKALRRHMQDENKENKSEPSFGRGREKDDCECSSKGWQEIGK